MSIDNLDDMIKKYTEELEKMGKTYGGETERIALTPSVKAEEGAEEKTTSYSSEEENSENTPETASEAPENTYTEDESDNEDEELTSEAYFSAAVFSGEEAYPVENARIVIYRDDSIYAFLETDKNGATKKTTLPSFSKENSLEADNSDRSVNYFADVFAEGFIAQKGLLVEAVGGSDVFLKVLMVPEGERIG